MPKNIKKKVLFFSMAAILIIPFQNCTKTSFGEATSSSTAEVFSSFAGPSLILEDGRLATNKKILSAKFENYNPHIKKFRLAEASQFSESTPWQPFTYESQLDLSSSFAADGSKDRMVVVKAELSSDVAGEASEFLEAQILLDTIPPVALGAGILANGPDRDYAPGESIKLRWTSQDIPSPSSGLMSGFGYDALSIGYSPSNSCDGNVTWVEKNIPNDNSYLKFPWQAKTPLDTFYICLILQDKAGNSVTVLSQPMTRLWKVIAGDNSQGNGGSAKAFNVRFNHPQNLALSPRGSVYIYDSSYRNIREIDPQGRIRLLAGNPMKPVQEGNALDSSLPGPGSGTMTLAVDSKDNLYFFGNGAIWRVSNTSSFFMAAQLTKLTGYLGWSAAVTVDQSTDTLYIGNIGDWSGATTGSYILKIPLSELQAPAKPDLAALVAKYKFAGNGTVPYTFDWKKLDVTADDPVASSFAAAVGEKDEFYYSTWQINGGPGAYQVRLIKPDADGVLHNYLLAENLSYVYDLEFVKTSAEKFLLIGNSSGNTYRIDVKNCTLGTAKCPVTLAYSQVGIASSMKARVDKDVVSYVTASPYESKVYVRDDKFKKVSSFGRDVYNANDNGGAATAAIINSPHELVVDKRGDIILFESRTNVFRKITADGRIHLLAGTPFPDSGLSRGVSYDLLDAKFYSSAGRSLGYDAANDNLYFSIYGALLYKIDLGLKKVSLYGPDRTSDGTNPLNWYTDSMLLSPQGAGKDPELYLSRFMDMGGGNRSTVLKYSGAGGLTSEVFLGDPTKPSFGSLAVGMTTSTASFNRLWQMTMDSAKNIYYIDGGILNVDADGIFQRSAPIHNMSVAIAEEDAKKYFIGVGGALVMSQASGPAKQLCFPGSKVAGAGSPVFDTEGNLLFVDEYNSRVIKYTIKNQGKLDFVTIDDPRCPK